MFKAKTIHPLFQNANSMVVAAVIVSASAELAATQHKMETLELKDIRGLRYCEIPLVYEQTFQLGETKTFGGIDARYGATLPLATTGSGDGDPYMGFTSSKKQTMVFRKELPIYELVDSDGFTYILNAYGDGVAGGDPANLANQLSLAEGWSFRVTTPGDDLIVATPKDGRTHMVGDDMHQYYTRIDTGS